jgi:hypothetical protein
MKEKTLLQQQERENNKDFGACSFKSKPLRVPKDVLNRRTDVLTIRAPRVSFAAATVGHAFDGFD